MPILAAILAAVTAVVAAGCGGSDSGIAPTSVIPTRETFNGTLPLLEIRSHTFTVARQGVVDVTLTSAGPPEGVTVGLAVGTPETDGCEPITIVAATAGSAPQLSGTATAGTLCVAIFDPGLLAAEIQYEIIVSHP